MNPRKRRNRPTRSRAFITLWASCVFIFFSYKPLWASIIATDTVYVSSISGRTSGNGISFSTHMILGSGANLTLQEAGGSVTTASSASASAFFGDSSHLTGMPGFGLSSTQTFSGSNTFVSSFTIVSGGRAIILSTSTTTDNISINPDGSILFSPELHNSSSTIIPQYSTSVSSYGPCVTGSTLTITTTGGRVAIVFTGTLTATNGPNLAGISFLVDGAFAPGLSNEKGFLTNVTQIYPFTLDYILDRLSPGIHQFCLTIAAPSSLHTVTLRSSSDPFINGSSNIFYVKELK